MNQKLTTLHSDDVADYLLQHPQFFEEYADVLASIKLTSPLVGRAISLQERQAEVLRDKIRTLELDLSHLLRTAKDNENIATTYQQWVDTLLRASIDATLPLVLTDSLANLFRVPQVTLRLWQMDETYQDAWFATAKSDSLTTFAHSLISPYCGEIKDVECVQWLKDPASVQSVAIIPLFTQQKAIPSGLLVLASDDLNRFTATMHTDFLMRIGEIASASLSHLAAQDAAIVA